LDGGLFSNISRLFFRYCSKIIIDLYLKLTSLQVRVFKRCQANFGPDRREQGRIMSLSPETRIKETFLQATSNKEIGAMNSVLMTFQVSRV
jgi:hypothetical protein